MVYNAYGQNTIEHYRLLYYNKNNYSKVRKYYYKLIIFHKLSYRWLKINSALIKKEHVNKIYNNSCNRYYNYQKFIINKT